MQKLIFILVLLFSTGIFGLTFNWEKFDDNNFNSINYWITQGYEIAHIQENAKNYRVIYTLQKIEKGIIICIVNNNKMSEPTYSLCYHEVN